MAAAGHMAEEDVPPYIPKNVITRSLGPHDTVNVDLEGPYDAAAGDVFLLCSDGLSGQVPDAELGALLHCLTPVQAVQTLVDLANLRGGPDNISVVVARVVGDGGPPVKQTSQDQLDTVVGSTAPRPRSMFLQATSVAALFALAFSLVNEFWTAATIAGAVLLTAVGFLVAGRNRRNGSTSPAFSLGGPYGNGPYRESTCEPNEKVVSSLAEMGQTLRDLPEIQSMGIDWKPLEELGAAGKTAADAGDYCTAIRRYAEALRAIMQQLRQHRNAATDDSGIYRTR
jgi:protein phosphatase